MEGSNEGFSVSHPFVPGAHRGGDCCATPSRKKRKEDLHGSKRVVEVNDYFNHLQSMRGTTREYDVGDHTVLRANVVEFEDNTLEKMTNFGDFLNHLSDSEEEIDEYRTTTLSPLEHGIGLKERRRREQIESQKRKIAINSKDREGYEKEVLKRQFSPSEHQLKHMKQQFVAVREKRKAVTLLPLPQREETCNNNGEDIDAPPTKVYF
jgi:hypothetical protein